MPRLAVLVVALAAATGGCTNAPVTIGAPRLAVTGGTTVTDGTEALARHYALGKQQLADGDPSGSLASFDAALGIDRGNVEARNGRATALAQLGRVDEAIDELRWAILKSPRSAHLHNNLGYLYATKGRLDEAADALRAALDADPSHERARSNWIALTGMRTRAEQAAAATKVAPRPTQPSPVVEVAFGVSPDAATARPRSDASTAPGSSPAIRVEFGAPNAEAPTPSTRPSASTAPRSAATAAAGTPAPVDRPAVLAAATAVSTPAAAPAATQVVVEVSNGAGATGLARRTARTLRDAGIDVGRITNWRDFRQGSTVLHHRPERLAEARVLQKRLGLPANALIADASLRQGVDARLVLGRDATAGVSVDAVRRADYLDPLREQAAALQALLDASFL